MSSSALAVQSSIWNSEGEAGIHLLAESLTRNDHPGTQPARAKIRGIRGYSLRLLLLAALSLPLSCAFAQQGDVLLTPLPASESSDHSSPDTQSQPAKPEVAQPGATGSATDAEPSDARSSGAKAANPATPPVEKQQPKRILGVMPNFRAVSAGALPAPPTPKQAFVIATRNSFDYSSFVFVGLTSAFAEWSNAHPQLGEGMTGYGRYYWRGFVDKTDGNYLVIFALPTIFHQDERYFAKGEGGFRKRVVYATSRILITPNYQGHDSFNVSELLGRGMAQGISLAYYPSKTRTAGAILSKYGYALLRDAATNAFREFWPDIAVHVLHRNP